MAAELLTKHKKAIESLTLVPGDGGCFEITRNGQLLFSKLKLKRFPEEGEVAKLVASARGG